MVSYKIELIDYSYRPIKVIRDSTQSFAGQSFNNILNVQNSGYKQLEFSIPYYILDENSTSFVLNDLVNYIYNEALIQYTVFLEDSSTETDYFIVNKPNKDNDDNGPRLVVTCIPYHVRRLSSLGINKTLGGEDEAPQTIGEWLAEVLAGTDWTVGAVADLVESVSVYDQDGVLHDVEQTKRRSVSISGSNLYNMIQELCTLFECYALFTSVVVDGVMNNSINIVETIGVDSGLTFEYEKNIDATHVSYDGDNIVTKLYAFGGEHPTNGLINISSVNPTLEPYIINMDYYISIGLFTDEDQTELDEFLEKLTNLNKTLLSISNKYNDLSYEIIGLNADIYTYKELIDSLKATISDNQKTLLTYKSGSAEYTALNATITSQQSDLATKQAFYNKQLARQTIVTNQLEQYTDMIESIDESKEEIYRQMNVRFGNFLREGMFSDESYMYADQLYSDALIVSERVCYPEKTYNIEIALLTEDNLNAGDTIRIIDATIGLTDAEAVVKSVSFVLDDMSKSTVEISNVISKFEDLYGKIIRTTTIINDKISILNKTLGAFNGNGVLKSDSLQNALNVGNYILKLNSIGSITTTDEGLFVYDVDAVNGVLTPNYNEGMKIVSKGIYGKLTADEDWTRVFSVSGGVNASYLRSGIIDADKIVIMNGEDPAFSWNKYGLIAYDDEAGVITYDNYSKFYKNGLELYQNAIQRLILGKNSTQYGLFIFDNLGAMVMQTSDNGDLWLQKYLSVGGSSPDDNLAGISGVGALVTSVRFWAGDTYLNKENAPFVVTDDGSVIASRVDVAGKISATIGSIQQYLTVGINDNVIIIDGGLDEDGVEQRENRLYSKNWSLNGDGSADFGNVNIRGTINASVFNYEEISATAGSMMVMNATALDADLIITDIAVDTIITLVGNDSLLYTMFKINDVLLIQHIEEGLRQNFWFIVTAEKLIDGTGDIAVLPLGVSSIDELPDKFDAGSVVLNYGQGATSSGIMLVGASVEFNYAPYMDIFEATKITDVGDPLVGTYAMNGTPKLRLGRLDGITSFLDDEGDPITDEEGNIITPTGYGLYADNVFLKGTIIASNCRITNSAFTGNLYLGTLDSGNVVISDRRVSTDETTADWRFVIYPDDIDGDPDTTIYKFLSLSDGIFIRNYNMYFYDTDALTSDPDEAIALFSTETDNVFFVAERIGNYFINETNYLSGQLYNNTLRFTNKTFAGTPTINDFDLTSSPIFEVGLTPTLTSYYGFIGAQENIPVVFGVSKTVSEISQFDDTKEIKVGVNMSSPTHDVEVKSSVGAGSGLFLTDSGSDVIKVIKKYDSVETKFYLDFYIL